MSLAKWIFYYGEEYEKPPLPPEGYVLFAPKDYDAVLTKDRQYFAAIDDSAESEQITG